METEYYFTKLSGATVKFLFIQQMESIVKVKRCTRLLKHLLLPNNSKTIWYSRKHQQEPVYMDFHLQLVKKSLPRQDVILKNIHTCLLCSKILTCILKCISSCRGVFFNYKQHGRVYCCLLHNIKLSCLYFIGLFDNIIFFSINEMD